MSHAEPAEPRGIGHGFPQIYTDEFSCFFNPINPCSSVSKCSFRSPLSLLLCAFNDFNDFPVLNDFNDSLALHGFNDEG